MGNAQVNTCCCPKVKPRGDVRARRVGVENEYETALRSTSVVSPKSDWAFVTARAKELDTHEAAEGSFRKPQSPRTQRVHPVSPAFAPKAPSLTVVLPPELEEEEPRFYSPRDDLMNDTQTAAHPPPSCRNPFLSAREDLPTSLISSPTPQFATPLQETVTPQFAVPSEHSSEPVPLGSPVVVTGEPKVPPAIITPMPTITVPPTQPNATKATGKEVAPSRTHSSGAVQLVLRSKSQTMPGSPVRAVLKSHKFIESSASSREKPIAPVDAGGGSIATTATAKGDSQDSVQPTTLTTSTAESNIDPVVGVEHFEKHLRVLKCDPAMAPVVFEIWRSWYKNQARRFYSASMSLLRTHPLSDQWFRDSGSESEWGGASGSAPSVEETLWLYRFSVARQGNVNAALQMLREDLIWREEINAESLSHEVPSADMRRSICSVYAHGYYGTDKCGRPVYYDRLGSVNVKALFERFSRDEIVRYWVRSYETLLRHILPACSKAAGLRIYRGVTVLDLSGVTMGTFTKSRELISLLLGISQNHYPETMEKTYIIRSSWAFRAIFKLLKPMLAPETVAKIEFVDSGKEFATLSREIGECLPRFISDERCSEIDWCVHPRGVWLAYSPYRFPPVKC